MSQKLRLVLLLVGVVDSGVLLPATVVLPTVWDKLMGEGLLLKTREPLRCLWLSFTSLASGKDICSPERTWRDSPVSCFDAVVNRCKDIKKSWPV